MNIIIICDSLCEFFFFNLAEGHRFKFGPTTVIPHSVPIGPIGPIGGAIITDWVPEPEKKYNHFLRHVIMF